MSKTWETLFNLSSFMKYLLTKTLPDEKLEAPSYVLDSLYDLLAITAAWIDKIKPGTNDISLKNQLSEHSAQVLLSNRSNRSNEGNTSQFNIRNNDSTSDFPSGTPPHPPIYFSKEEVNPNAVGSLESTSKDISEAFMKLSKEMINGRPYGHYCRPCDLGIFSKKEWDHHMADRLHTFLMKECEIKHGSCVYCKLSIFASNRDSNKLFKYHEIEHDSQSHNNLPTKENTSANETKKKPFKSGRNDFDKSNLDVVSSRVSDSSFKTSQRMSSVFIELDKKMHSGIEKGFYCHICDKAFEVVTEWNMHFQEVAVHNDQYDSSCSFEMCDSCGLVIFAVPSIQKWYKSHHMRGHYCFEGEKKSNFKSSVESLQSIPQSQENFQSYKNNTPYQNNQPTNTYKISQQFKNFNAQIHAHNLQGHFFCRPCSATLSPEEWIQHSVNRKHLELMASRKFKNWKGTCTYCSLTIIGTRDTVKYYMEFHSTQHNKVISYDLVKISSNDMPNNFTSNHPRRKQRTRKIASPTSISTLDDEEDRSDFEDKEINISKNEQTSSISSEVNGETSWYASSREEQLLGSFRQLIESRTKEKYSSGSPQFGALCTLCEFTISNAFEWEDHLLSDEHNHRISPQDRQAYLSDLNIYLFGSLNVLEKHKALVKGNWSFI